MATLPGTRIRNNGVVGTVTDNPLTIGAVTFNSENLSKLGVVLNDHAIVTLDPLRQYGEPEIIMVTAHTAESTVATVQRGMYGTPARAHPAGTLWVHAAVSNDFIEIVTSTSRPADPYKGQMIYETDTGLYKSFTGLVWAGFGGGGGVTEHGDLSGLADDDHTQYQLRSEKGVANGYAGLDVTGVVPLAQLPTTIATDGEVATAITNHESAADPHPVYQRESEKDVANGYAGLNASGLVPESRIDAAIARDSEVTTAVSDHAGAADPHTGYQKESEKGAANGYASLDASTLVPKAQLGTGTPTSTNYLRGDGTWAVPPGSGGGGGGVSADTPVGGVVAYYGSTAPDGWLLCDGAAIPAEYTELIALVGANTPNFKGRVLVGRDAAQTEFDVLGETGGAKTHTLTSAEMPSHTHVQNSHTHEGFSGATPITQSGNGLVAGSGNPTVVSAGQIATGTAAINQNTGGGGAHNNLQPYAVVNWIIKAEPASGSGGSSDIEPIVWMGGF